MIRQRPNIQKGNARAAAFGALLAWDHGAVYAQELLEREVARHQLEAADRALAKELFFGVLRNLSLLDRFIGELRKKGSLKRPVRELLRMGLFQLFKTQIADYAAVNETVRLALQHERGLVNAILREAMRTRDQLLAESGNWPLEDRFSHPRFLIDRWISQFGEEPTQALCEWNNRPAAVYARICDAEAYAAELKKMAPDRPRPEPVKSFPEFVKLPPGPPPEPWLAKGIVFIQDPATSLACHLLAPQSGECILDACAAPGGKTTLLRAMAPEDCRIVATDSSEIRLERLKENLGRLKMDDVVIQRIDWTQPAPRDIKNLPPFDAILLDVPCSNSGVMQRRVDVRWRLSPGDFSELAALQLKLLKNVALQLKPGGRIIYSTCSVDREENHGLIESSGLELEEMAESLPWKSGFDGAFACRLKLRS